MTVRNSKDKSRARSRLAFRIDLRRALLAIAGAAGVLVLVFSVVTTRQEPQTENQADVFGPGMRAGSILVMPLVGDACRLIAFDNDSGTIVEGEPVSCNEALSRSAKNARKTTTNYVGAVSETFRK